MCDEISLCEQRNRDNKKKASNYLQEYSKEARLRNKSLYLWKNSIYPTIRKRSWPGQLCFTHGYPLSLR